jgi:hypothetical protein
LEIAVTGIVLLKALHLQEVDFMKKALQRQNEVFLIEFKGKPMIWDFFAQEIVAAVNGSPLGGPEHLINHRVLAELRAWLDRYLAEDNGELSDGFLDKLNADLREIHYTRVVLPLDVLPSEIGVPRNAYMRRSNPNNTPEALAADDFSKLLTSGELKRLRRCQLEGCKNYFLGPPQAKWCSKSCGSKFRVRKKRKRESL